MLNNKTDNYLKEDIYEYAIHAPTTRVYTHTCA